MNKIIISIFDKEYKFNDRMIKTSNLISRMVENTDNKVLIFTFENEMKECWEYCYNILLKKLNIDETIRFVKNNYLLLLKSAKICDFFEFNILIEVIETLIYNNYIEKSLIENNYEELIKSNTFLKVILSFNKIYINNLYKDLNDCEIECFNLIKTTNPEKSIFKTKVAPYILFENNEITNIIKIERKDIDCNYNYKKEPLNTNVTIIGNKNYVGCEAYDLKYDYEYFTDYKYKYFRKLLEENLKTMVDIVPEDLKQYYSNLESKIYILNSTNFETLKKIFENWCFNNKIYTFVCPKTQFKYYIICNKYIHFSNNYPKVINNFPYKNDGEYYDKLILNKYLLEINERIFIIDEYNDESDYTYSEDFLIFK